jgi:DNA-binding PucR family transcriptional regulator
VAVIDRTLAGPPPARGLATSHSGAASLDVREFEVRSIVAGRLVEDRAILCAEMVDALWREIERYGAIEDPVRRDDVADMVSKNFDWVIDSVVRRDMTMEEEYVDIVRELAYRRARQGFPLYAVQRAFQVGMRMAWDAVNEQLSIVACSADLTARITAATSTAIIDLGARIGDELTRAYVEYREQMATVSVRQRRELLELLVGGGSRDEAEVRRLATEAGYRLGQAHVVIVCQVASDDPALSREQLGRARRQTAAALSELRPTGAAPIVDHYEAGICAIVMTEPGRHLRELIGEATKRLSTVQLGRNTRLVAGASQVVSDISEIARAYRQAHRTADLAHRLRGWPVLTTYSEMLPYHLLSSDLALAEDIYSEFVAVLMSSTDRIQSELVETLRVYLSDRRGARSVSQTAAELAVHRHTVSARLGRVEKLTGVDLSDPYCLLMLQLGLRAEELLRSTHARTEPQHFS